MFYEQYNITKDFILDEILKGLLGIVRDPSSEIQYFHEGQADIDEELESYDEAAQKVSQGNEKHLQLLMALKDAISIWFDRKRCVDLYREFKEVVTVSMLEMLDSPALKAYIEMEEKQNKNIRRHEWLSLYYSDEVSFCLWPTIYQALDDVLHDGDENKILKEVENEELIHAHCSLIDVHAKVLPPK